MTVLLWGSGILPYQRLPVLSSGAVGKLSAGRGPDGTICAPLSFGGASAHWVCVSGQQTQPPSGIHWAWLRFLRLLAALWALPGSRGDTAAPEATCVPDLTGWLA